MNRAVTILQVTSTFALIGVAAASGANAQPVPPGTPCSFSLSPPQVVRVADADMVRSTVTFDNCGGPFRPSRSVVCIQGADATTQCSQARDFDTAEVLTPYRAGATYTATGRGLGAVFDFAAEPNWLLLGPITAVL